MNGRATGIRVLAATALLLFPLSGRGLSATAGSAPSQTPASVSAPGGEERRILLMKQDLEKEIEENKALLEKIDKRLLLYRSLKKKGVRNLVKLYESMAPRTAASQIDVMSKTLRLTLFSGMDPRKASRIMRYVDPRVAAEISAQMAGIPPTPGGGQ
ncbi:MAG: MotE family protein [Leptospirales bacterium]